MKGGYFWELEMGKKSQSLLSGSPGHKVCVNVGDSKDTDRAVNRSSPVEIWMWAKPHLLTSEVVNYL